MADLVKDVQLIKSTILRQYLDGLYLANNPRQEAVEANIVEPSELLTSRPGGIVRVKERGSVNPITVPFIGDHAPRGLDYVDRIREVRSGVSPKTQGLADSPLHKTAAGQRMMMGAAQGKIELIARIFAETGVKRAFQIILALVTRYQQKERVIRLRNQWVEMNLMDLMKAPAYGRKKPLIAQAVYVAPPFNRRKERFRTRSAMVVRHDEPSFEPNALKPFLEKLGPPSL